MNPSLLRSRIVTSLGLLSAILGLLSAMLLVSACGDQRQAPETYDWDRSATALVASRGYAGGNVPQMMRFLEREMGSGLVRVYGDGTLYYGEPQKLFERKLDEDAMQALFQGMRPDLFDGYEEEYQASLVTDAPTTDVQVAVKVYGSHEIGIYALGAVDDASKGSVPDSLLKAAEALAKLRVGGEVHEPTKLRLGANSIDLKHYPEFDAATIAPWPIDSIDLSKTSFYENKTLRIEDPATLAAVLKAVPAIGQHEWRPTPTSVFSQGGQFYHVVWAISL